jgi:hypothetical protein
LTLGLSLAGCTKGNQVNGRSLKTANKSVSYIKERLPIDQRIEFEVSFWTLRDDIRDNKEFLAAVDGKTPEALIEMGKELFAKRKASGFKGYDAFSNWEQMIANYSQERIDQNRKAKADPRDKQNNVLYKLSGT